MLINNMKMYMESVFTANGRRAWHVKEDYVIKLRELDNEKYVILLQQWSGTKYQLTFVGGDRIEVGAEDDLPVDIYTRSKRD